MSFVNVVKKNGYIYMPPKVFQDSVSTLVWVPLNSSKKIPNKEISIAWNSGCHDGGYLLIITPEQLYFRCGHDNPNPNFIFWVISIDSSQYLQIRNGLKTKLPKWLVQEKKRHFFDPQNYWDKNYKDDEVPENWNDTTSSKYWADCNVNVEKQLTKCFYFLNAYITDSNKKITPILKSEIKEQRRKYIGAFKEEIIDWLPYKAGTVIE